MDVTGPLVNNSQTPNRKGNIAQFKYVFESAADNLTALAGGGQPGATQIASEIARFTTVATAGDSAMLPPTVEGLTITVINRGAKPLQMYGNGTDTIDDQAAATGVSQMASSTVIFVCTGIGKWYANGLGTGFAGAFETQSYTDGLTARAGGGQNLAPIITTMMSRFTIVGTTADSTTLPVGVAGMNLTVINAAASNSMNVFPDTGSTINALSANTAFALAAGKTCVFVTTVAGAWHTIPLVP
jgi:hypothetical protein